MASSSTSAPSSSPPLPPPSLSTDQDADETLQRMLDRMSTHTPVTADSASVDEDDEDGEETWHDAREDEGEEDEKATIKEEAELDLDELEAMIATATELKTQANALFRLPSSTSSALSSYLRAVNALPPRPPPPPETQKIKPAVGSSNSDGVQIEEISEEEAERIERGETDEEKARRVMAARISELRGVCWSNAGACYMKMGQHKKAADACTEALKDSPTYTKALHRRATANVAVNTWSSLTSAQEDLKALLPLLPSSPPSALYKQSSALLASLPPKIKTMQDREKDEMMDKLKGLGNTVLGKFGLSTDNFKFEPNGAGGYSMNFVR